jgi:hypothetical protein
VLFSPILVTANEALLKICEIVEGSDRERDEISARVVQGRKGLASHLDPETSLCLDYDILAGRPIRARTVAGFAALIASALNAERQAETM